MLLFGGYTCAFCDEKKCAHKKLYDREVIQRHKCDGSTFTCKIEYSRRKHFFLEKLTYFLHKPKDLSLIFAEKCVTSEMNVVSRSECMKSDHLLKLFTERTLNTAFDQVYKLPPVAERKVHPQMKNFAHLMKTKFGSNSLRFLRGSSFEQAPETVKKQSLGKKLFPFDFFENYNFAVPSNSTLQKDTKFPTESGFRHGRFGDFLKHSHNTDSDCIIKINEGPDILPCIITADGILLKQGLTVCQTSGTLVGKINTCKDKIGTDCCLTPEECLNHINEDSKLSEIFDDTKTAWASGMENKWVRTIDGKYSALYREIGSSLKKQFANGENFQEILQQDLKCLSTMCELLPKIF